MATSSTEICNLALSHLGISKEIASLTESSQEASACRRFYEVARDETLRDVSWPFASKFATLGLVEEDPTEEWAYSYRYPSDCLKLRRLLSGTRNDTRQSKIPYKIARDDSGQLLYTDLDDATAEYTLKVEDVTMFPVDFVLALSYRIAYHIAPRITAGDPFGLRKQAMELYMMELTKAARNAFNEEQAEELPESEFVRARE